MKTTPKDFFLWAGAMVALYVSVISFLTLMFEYINRAFPDVLESSYYSDPYSGPIRFAIASLAVAFPVFLLLMRLIRKDIYLVPEKRNLWVRRWALHLTLFIAGATIAIDLITLINTYLGGDVTARFALKVLVVLLVAVGGFLHFLADLRGHWFSAPKKTRLIAWVTGLLVIATIAAGVLIMGTPAQVRLYRIDNEKVGHLQNIQWQVVNYWQSHEKLPEKLSDLDDPLSGYKASVDPQTGEQYKYEVISADKLSFKLCATFNADTQSPTRSDLAVRPVDGGKGALSDSWWHGVGEVCFVRTIDPELYPPYPPYPKVR